MWVARVVCTSRKRYLGVKGPDSFQRSIGVAHVLAGLVDGAETRTERPPNVEDDGLVYAFGCGGRDDVIRHVLSGGIAPRILPVRNGRKRSRDTAPAREKKERHRDQDDEEPHHVLRRWTGHGSSDLAGPDRQRLRQGGGELRMPLGQRLAHMLPERRGAYAICSASFSSR